MKEKQKDWGVISLMVESLELKDLPKFLYDMSEDLLTMPNPFGCFMRSEFREKGILQQDVFLAADLSENYGYKLVSGEKHTVNRDVIMRMCIAAHFNKEETNEALTLYGMSSLHVGFPRDIVFIAAIRNKLWDIHQVNDLLISCGLDPMLTDTE